MGEARARARATARARARVGARVTSSSSEEAPIAKTTYGVRRHFEIKVGVVARL